MKRTTIKIDESVLRKLKQKAAAEGVSLQDVANQLLRRGLASAERSRFTLVMQGWKAQPLPGVDIVDRDTLFDVMNGR